METILLLEDDADVRGLLQRVLLQHGYTVLVAGGGPEALRVAAQCPHSIHLLITDVILPNMSCDAVLARLKNERPALKVIYISGYTSEMIKQHGIADSRINFLQKPFTPDALARKVREVLDMPEKGFCTAPGAAG